MTPPPRITADDIGFFYEGPGDTLWRLISYTDQPTARFERVHPNVGPERRDGVVGAPIFEGFRKLVPQDPQ